jgi:hypothetical protein
MNTTTGTPALPLPLHLQVAMNTSQVEQVEQVELFIVTNWFVVAMQPAAGEPPLHMPAHHPAPSSTIQHQLAATSWSSVAVFMCAACMQPHAAGRPCTPAPCTPAQPPISYLSHSRTRCLPPLLAADLERAREIDPSISGISTTEPSPKRGAVQV